MGLSVSLDIAAAALRAQQLAVDVTSHNISNANTPGFSRQEVHLRAIGPVRANGSVFAFMGLVGGVGLNVVGCGLTADRRSAGLPIGFADRYPQQRTQKITLPDGSTVASGTTDEKGRARVDGIDPGTCKVTFPELDRDAWEPM